MKKEAERKEIPEFESPSKDKRKKDSIREEMKSTSIVIPDNGHSMGNGNKQLQSQNN
jgi:hypothetical protein